MESRRWPEGKLDGSSPSYRFGRLSSNALFTHADPAPQAEELSFASRSSGADSSSPLQLHSSPAPGVVPQIESLPLFRDVPVLERQALFLRKLWICSVLFDFSDTLKLAREKEVKRQTLSELVDFVQSGSARLNEQVQEELVRTVDVNIFCSLPLASHENTGVEPTDPEEEDPYRWEISISGDRFQNCLREIRKLARDVEDVDKGVLIRKEDWQKLHVHIASYNNFPTAVGLASSAAGFACLVFTLAKLMNVDQDHGKLSSIARQGSGSACRSLYGGFVKWAMGDDARGSDSIAVPLAPESHWNDLVIIIAVLGNDQQGLTSPRLKEHMEYCINHPEEMSRLSKLKAHITEVKGIMMDNIEKFTNLKHSRVEIDEVRTDPTAKCSYQTASPLISLEYSNRWDPMTDERSSIGSSQEAPQIYRFNLEEIECATQYFSEVNLLSKKSSFAATYKGILHDGTEVAVKRINKTSCKSEEAEFLMGLKALTLLRHENLVGLRGFCYSRARGECFLIYDFVANGSLSEYLDVKCDEIHKVLDWSVRVCIIKGIAKGILLDLYDYLFSFSDSYHNEYTTVTTTATNIDHLRWNFILSFTYICTLP
ncbi:hypothetical protein ZIOFF_013848 [Zingiber officinale]|uniref:Protein kinase domain-containing protein n=1 Tax=Zingiber officinale TaxID=94328 RepID=A0A8J5H9Q2_ZINOF|nr:hypothetical protein ZIOFF_013848 [Zingiber officinale]